MTRTHWSFVIASLLTLTASITARADVSLPPVLGDHMVLQQQTDATIWGWANPDQTITVTGSWNNQPVQTIATADGSWAAALPTPDAGGPYTLTVTGETTITLNDILVGEVWVCSGQSNMAFPTRLVTNADAELARADLPRVRLYSVAHTISLHPRMDSPGVWTPCTPQTAASFSGIGYLFARELSARLGVPVGIVQADWGGTRIQTWMSASMLSPIAADSPSLAQELDRIERDKDPTTRMASVEQAQLQWWRRLHNLGPTPPGQAWLKADYDDSGWDKATLPATLAGDLAGFDGIVRYRRHIDLPEAFDNQPAILELGPIDDRDEAWINGVLVGATRQDGRWGQPRRYEVPKGVLRAGDNIIAVHMYDTSGPGGINGSPDQLRLTPTADKSKAVPLAGSWRRQIGPSTAQLPPIPTGAPINQNTATALYSGMIAPIHRLTIAGVLWYQGESNRSEPDLYARLMPAMIRGWRKAFANESLPFHFVQIAPYRYPADAGQTALLREAQASALDLPHTGMAVTLDVGNPSDIHPRTKQPVADRLVRLALNDPYGQDIAASGPVLRSMHELPGGRVELSFDHAEGLRDAGNGLHGFQIAGIDRRFVDADASIQGQTVIVSSPGVPDPVAVRYAWSAAPAASLFNHAGLPAAPFRTDRWSDAVYDNSAAMAQYRSTDPGMVDLFDGETLTGWVNVNCADSTWTVARDADGPMIHCTGVPTGVLRTTKMYRNFVLELEFRHLVAGGNAGVFVWSDAITARGQPFTRSVEVQVMDGREGRGYTSDGDIFPIHGAVMTPRNGQGGSRAFPTERRMNPSPQWNHYRIVCREGSISLAVNGKVVTRGDDIKPLMGYVCLESEGSPIDFRNIRIKQLPETKRRLRPDEVAAADDGFRNLYSGVDFKGWDLTPEHEGHWRAADWTIVSDGQGPDLWTTDSYRDFVLICDWRWTAQPTPTDRPVILPSGEAKLDADGKPVMQTVPDAGDSGIYLRGSSKSQVNLWCWPIGSGEVYGYRTDPNMPAAVRAGVTPSAKADAPIGQWNRTVITMKGDRLTVVLNGQTVIDHAQLPGVAEAGPIALQRHGSPIQFANIYIKTLSEE